MRMVLVVGVAAMGLGGCLHQKEFAAADQAKAACKAQSFKTMTELARCEVDAHRLTKAAWGNNESLVELGLAQKLVLAEKVDRGEISKSEYELEIAKLKVRLEAAATQRQAAAPQSLAGSALQGAADGLARAQAANAVNRPLNCTSTNMSAGTVNTMCY